MKTEKFEKTIRQKLESISPDFHENDWTKMQNYMQVHTPPTFWQQYGSWLGYAAAASVSTVMAFLYINQLSQTKRLVRDVKKLQSQIEVIKNAPVTIAKTDTVYLIQKEAAQDQLESRELAKARFYTENDGSETADEAHDRPETGRRNGNTYPEAFVKTNVGRSEKETNSLNASDGSGKPVQKSKNTVEVEHQPQVIRPADELLPGEKSAPAFASVQPGKRKEDAVSSNQRAGHFEVAGGAHSAEPPMNTTASKTLDGHFAEIKQLQTIQSVEKSRQLRYALLNRLSSREARKVWLASIPDPVNPPMEQKKGEQVTKTENIIPRLNIKAPYRFGGAIQFEGKNQVKTVLGEVLLAKKFSISAGVSWLKIKPMEFFTETIFREKNSKDFKRSHPNEVPLAFEILNINVKPTLIQIPLTVAFRNDLKDNFSYFVGVGTNVTVKGREKFTFDCRVPNPNQEFLNKEFERKMDIPLLNSVNFSIGIEKTWHPIVVQVEGYVHNYFKPISPESSRTGPGVKLKLLYQIGKKM